MYITHMDSMIGKLSGEATLPSSYISLFNQSQHFKGEFGPTPSTSYRTFYSLKVDTFLENFRPPWKQEGRYQVMKVLLFI